MDGRAAAERSSRTDDLFFKQFNWRMVLVRILVNGLALLVTAALLPHVYLFDWSLLSMLLLGAILGLLNAIVRPILQFLTLSFIFVTYGLVVVVINTVILLLLALLLPGRFGVDSLFWAMIAGAVMGILAGALESLLGLSFPILPDGPRAPERTTMLRAQPAAVPALAETGAIEALVTVEGEGPIGESQTELSPGEVPSAVDPLPVPGTAAEISAGEGLAATEQGQRSPITREEER